MNYQDFNNQTETELNAKGIEFALNETLNQLGLNAKISTITITDVTYKVYSMEHNIFIGDITFANSESLP